MTSDTVKAIVKDQAKKIVSKKIDSYLDKNASVTEAESLKADIYNAIRESQFSDEQKNELKSGFDVLFKNVDDSGV